MTKKGLEKWGDELCPISAMAQFLPAIDWDPNSSSPLFNANIRERLTSMTKQTASENNVNGKRIGTHSLRSGGANAMFVAGYDAEVIKRWGRWRSDTFAFYMWNDERVLSTVGKGMMKSGGLLPQLQRQSVRDMDKEMAQSNGRAGGKGGKKKGGKTCTNEGERMFQISKKLSHICRHDRYVFRQENGFVPLHDILNSYRWPEYAYLNVTEDDLKAIIGGAGGNHKKRFEWGRTDTGDTAIRTSQGHSRNAGVTSEYLNEVHRPGLLSHGTSWANSREIARYGLNRGDRLHIHFGELKNGRPSGTRYGSEAVIVVDGDLCVREEIKIFRSENNVYLSEGTNGVIGPRFISRIIDARSGQTVYTRTHGWLEDETSEGIQKGKDRSGGVSEIKPQHNEPKGSSSRESLMWDIAPETEEYRALGRRGKKKYFVNEDPFDGIVSTKVEIESEEEREIAEQEQIEWVKREQTDEEDLEEER